MVIQPPVVPEQDLLDPVSARNALPGVWKYQRQYTFYGIDQYQTKRNTTLVTALGGAELQAKMVIHNAPAEYCLPVKKDRRFSPVFQVKVSFVWQGPPSGGPVELDFAMYAYPLSVEERQTLEAGASGEPPHLPELLRDLALHGRAPVFVDRHTYFRGPCNIARRSVTLHADKETEVQVPFEGLEFVKPSSMSPMTIAFAMCVGDTRDVALALMTPSTICVCRADQRADAATKLGYSDNVFSRVNERDGGQKYKTVFNPPGARSGRSRNRGGTAAAAAQPPPPSPRNGTSLTEVLELPMATPGGLQLLSTPSTSASPYAAAWRPGSATAAASHSESEGVAARQGAASSMSWAGGGAPELRAGEPSAAALRQRHQQDSVMDGLYALLGEEQPQLPAASAVSAFECAAFPGFDEFMHMEGMEWDDMLPEQLDGHGSEAGDGDAAHGFTLQGGFPAAGVTFADLSSFPAEPAVEPHTPAPPPAADEPCGHAAAPPPAAVGLTDRAAAPPRPAAVAALAAGTASAYGNHGLPHWMRPECRPVPTAVALGSRVAPPAAPVQAWPAPAVAGPDAQEDAAMAGAPGFSEDLDMWLERDLQVDLPAEAPFSVFSAADDVPGFGMIAQRSMQGMDDILRPLAEHRDRDEDGNTWMLSEIYDPRRQVQPPPLAPWHGSGAQAQPGRQHGHTAAAPMRRARDRSPPRPHDRGGRPAAQAPLFQLESRHGGVLNLEELLEPLEPAATRSGQVWRARPATPFCDTDGFNVEPFSFAGPAAAPDAAAHDVVAGGFRADLPGPHEESGETGSVGEVGFGGVQAPAMFDGMRPASGACNLQDLLQLRRRGAAAATDTHAAQHAAARHARAAEPAWPGWAAEGPATAAHDMGVPGPPGPGEYAGLEPQIEDPTEGAPFGEDLMDILGSDIELGPDTDGGAFMVPPYGFT